MIPSLRKQFNDSFTPEKYQTFLQRMDDVCGTHVQFRLSETPCFFPKALIDRMAADGAGVDSATGGQSCVSREVGGGGAGRVQGSERAAASDVCAGGFWAGARCAWRVAAEAGGVAGLPFSLCLSGAAGGGLYRGVRTARTGVGRRASGVRLPAAAAEIFLERAGDGIPIANFCAGRLSASTIRRM